MDLHTQHRHLRGKSVGVNSTEYKVDMDGVCHGVSDKDATVLLQIEGWLPVEVAENASHVPHTRAGKASIKPIVAPGDGHVAQADAAAVEEELHDIPPGGDIPEVNADDVKSGLATWPDPTTSMDVEYLRQMASAYQIQFTQRTSKSTLVARVMEAMYPSVTPRKQ